MTTRSLKQRLRIVKVLLESKFKPKLSVIPLVDDNSEKHLKALANLRFETKHLDMIHLILE